MNQKEYIVEGRQFRTESDYARALRDRRIIEELRKSTDFNDIVALEKLRKELENGNYSFMTMLGELEETFDIEVDEAEASKIVTVQEALDYISQLQA